MSRKPPVIDEPLPPQIRDNAKDRYIRGNDQPRSVKRSPGKQMCTVVADDKLPCRLQPIQHAKMGRLPVLKHTKIPDINTSRTTQRAPRVPSKTPDLPTCALADATKKPTESRIAILPEKNTVTKSQNVIRDLSCLDVNRSNTSLSKFNDNILPKHDAVGKFKTRNITRRDTEHSRKHNELPQTQCNKITHKIQWTNDQTKVPWQKEKDALQIHRNQQMSAAQVPRKPVKAQATTQKQHNTGSSVKQLNNKEMKNKEERSPRKTVNLSVRRVTDDTDGWDWDKDVEEYLQLENKQTQSTSGPLTRSSADEGRVMCSVSRQNGRIPTPKSLECSKKGVGFRSRAKLEELKLQEEERKEKERRERERIAMMMPEKVRKGLKKYGFK